ncbi:hypothetical protein [Flavobacterium sp. LC2016-12]|uniref:hypothetical protein n=1 Tax=Flavobacterium sp. LC2016-12 TaxID=2783794 RepID=UPI00188C6EC4|nr:hypothetical protein [Flavobacterium sp. LC2016-12]MBF4466530.1 hypothetical protein [Flavobacterium sp. LC2016-12]
MNKLFILFFFISFQVFCQTKNECIKVLLDYSTNYGKPEYTFDYVDTKLNPTLTKVQTIICETNDKELLEKFFEMIIKSSGSANEYPADVLGNIFICNPEIVEEQLKGKFKNEMVFEYLEFGFLNVTADWPLNEKKKNLQNRMNKVIK